MARKCRRPTQEPHLFRLLRKRRFALVNIPQTNVYTFFIEKWRADEFLRMVALGFDSCHHGLGFRSERNHFN